MCINFFLSNFKGANDNYRFSPFWKEWNAVVQVNVHRKHSSAENSVFIPGYFVYSPHSSPHPHLPHPHHFDVSKPMLFDSQASAHISDPVSEDNVSI